MMSPERAEAILGICKEFYELNELIREAAVIISDEECGCCLLSHCLEDRNEAWLAKAKGIIKGEGKEEVSCKTD